MPVQGPEHQHRLRDQRTVRRGRHDRAAQPGQEGRHRRRGGRRLRGAAVRPDGAIGATAGQYPDTMAQLGVDAVAKFARTGKRPANQPGQDFINTGTKLYTDTRSPASPSLTTTQASKICWGGKRHDHDVTASEAPAGRRTPADRDDIPQRRQNPVQAQLHAHPSLGPLAVLILAAVVFEIINTRFFSRQPVDHAAGGRGDRAARARAERHHPDRRHRPVGRRGDDPVADGDGRLAVNSRRARRCSRSSSA